MFHNHKVVEVSRMGQHIMSTGLRYYQPNFQICVSTPTVRYITHKPYKVTPQQIQGDRGTKYVIIYHQQHFKSK